MWNSIFNMSIAFAEAHPVWTIVGILIAIWCIGKTHEKITTLSHEESMQMFDNINQILQGKIPAPKYTWQETLWNDFLKPILLSPFAIILIPFAYTYKKIDRVVMGTYSFATFPILVISELIKQIRKGNTVNQNEPASTSTVTNAIQETNDVEKKKKIA